MIHHGDCLQVLKTLAALSCDSLVTDPPAGISFMGKGWDGDKGGREQWVAWLTDVMAECHRVLKPGAHALVWPLPRTSHWTMTALEDAGFEIRDVVTHLFGTGFPKSLNVAKAGAGDAWEGFGTALKPACEFWVLCRKSLSEKTVAKNVLKWGTGAINVDGCRIAGSAGVRKADDGFKNGNAGLEGGLCKRAHYETDPAGRFPANLILDEEAAAALDEQSGTLSNKGSVGKSEPGASMWGIGQPSTIYRDIGGASRFFYVAKASKADRGEGNTHPTVKSTALMSYLVRLVTPPGGTVLDPFMGSGSTGVAAKDEGMQFIGIEQQQEYVETALRRGAV